MIRQLYRVVLWLCVMAPCLAIASDGIRVLPSGERPNDRRLAGLKDLNGYFPFDPPATREAWEERAAELRTQLQVALGLWPMPQATPLDAVIHGKVDRPEYTVERVYFQSYPGHFVTGSLYRPKTNKQRSPAILSPHGHWANGRFHQHNPRELANELASGGEKFERGGRHPLQARCVQLARMGCVVFHYDMLGYADSVQIEHRPGVRQAMNTPEQWGFFSPQAELRLQSMMGLQTYNSIRALDFLLSLPDVDPERIGVTGASGGGTQTFVLCAIDPRPKVAVPAVMVSTSMQGGCTCENCSYLRVGTGNVEMAALFAPKPLAMTAANDWTKEMETKGMPQLKQLYGLYGAEDLTRLAAYLKFGHNYNAVSRAAMYEWMNQRLPIGADQSLAERDYEPLSIAEMTVWDEDHPRPPQGDDYERSLLEEMTADSQQQLAEVDRSGELSGRAWRVLLGGKMPAQDALEVETKQIAGIAAEVAEQCTGGVLRDAARGAEIPWVLVSPPEKAGGEQARTVLWVSPDGKRGLFNAEGDLQPAVRQLVDSGYRVLGADLYLQGEFLSDGEVLEQQPMVSDALVGYAGYTFGYNYPLFSQRVQDLLALVAHAHAEGGEVSILGTRGAGALVTAAAAMAGDAVRRMAVDIDGFRFEQLTEFAHPDFLPGAVKYGDLPALLELCAPKPMLVAGDAAMLDRFGSALKSDAAEQVSQGNRDQVLAAMVEWLIR